MKNSVLLLFLAFICSFCFSQSSNPKELGNVIWLRDYDEALEQSKKETKPILILFQEVPGCATCRNYGQNVLSNPLLVESIQNEFIPLAIYNNKGGKDAAVLKKYGEPSWNNPVVRIMDAQGNMLVKRIGGDYSALTLVSRMKEALVKVGKEVPEYVHLLDEELKSQQLGHTKEKYFSMYCFWSGEKQLGSVDGVVSTESGFIGGAEVVKVLYDPFVVDEKTLKETAEQNKMIENRDGTTKFKSSPKDVHYYLQHSDYRFIPMTELQKTKINSALGNGANEKKYLSPKQLVWLSQMKQLGQEDKKTLAQQLEREW